QAGGPRRYISPVRSVSRNSPRSFQSAHESYLRQLAGLAFAAQMDEGLGSADAGFAPAPGRDDFMVLAPDALAVLAEVREQGPLLLVQHGRDVHVRVREKPLGLAAAVDLKKVELRFSQGHPRADRKQTGHLMVHVRIDRPVREQNVR